MAETESPKMQKDSVTFAFDKNPCSLCRVMLFLICKGHGASSGGGGASGGGDTTKTQTESSGQMPSAPETTDPMQLNPFWDAALQSTKLIKFDVGFLSIECDPKKGILTIESKLGLSKSDFAMVREFLNEVKNSFTRFKETTKNLNGQIKDNGYSITISIPDRNHFKAFIKHLEKENLLPTPIASHIYDHKKSAATKDKQPNEMDYFHRRRYYLFKKS